MEAIFRNNKLFQNDLVTGKKEHSKKVLTKAKKHKKRSKKTVTVSDDLSLPLSKVAHQKAPLSKDTHQISHYGETIRHKTDVIDLSLSSCKSETSYYNKRTKSLDVVNPVQLPPRRHIPSRSVKKPSSDLKEIHTSGVKKSTITLFDRSKKENGIYKPERKRKESLEKVVSSDDAFDTTSYAKNSITVKMPSFHTHPSSAKMVINKKCTEDQQTKKQRKVLNAFRKEDEIQEIKDSLLAVLEDDNRRKLRPKEYTLLGRLWQHQQF